MRSLAEASASMESEFRARQAESMENMRQMMEIISREKSAVVHRFDTLVYAKEHLPPVGYQLFSHAE